LQPAKHGGSAIRKCHIAKCYKIGHKTNCHIWYTESTCAFENLWCTTVMCEAEQDARGSEKSRITGRPGAGKEHGVCKEVVKRQQVLLRVARSSRSRSVCRRAACRRRSQFRGISRVRDAFDS
jgi:hypothetical protein